MLSYRMHNDAKAMIEFIVRKSKMGEKINKITLFIDD